jgi:hypothetical protein
MSAMHLSRTFLLLLGCHRDRVLVAVAMHADLVPGLGHLLHLLRESLDRMPGDEPSRLDAPAFEEIQETRGADFACEEAA